MLKPFGVDLKQAQRTHRTRVPATSKVKARDAMAGDWFKLHSHTVARHPGTVLVQGRISVHAGVRPALTYMIWGVHTGLARTDQTSSNSTSGEGGCRQSHEMCLHACTNHPTRLATQSTRRFLPRGRGSSKKGASPVAPCLIDPCAPP
jgi:hypothetical protein